jgi:fucose permease
LTGAYAVGRFLGIFIIMKIPPLFILSANLGLVLIGNIVLLVWANDNLTMLWTGCIILGAGFSTMFASYAAYMERHLVVTNSVGSCWIVVGSTMAAIYPLIVGGIIERNVVVLTYTNFFSIAVCTIPLLIIYKLTHRSTERIRF